MPDDWEDIIPLQFPAEAKTGACYAVAGKYRGNGLYDWGGTPKAIATFTVWDFTKIPPNSTRRSSCPS